MILDLFARISYCYENGFLFKHNKYIVCPRQTLLGHVVLKNIDYPGIFITAALLIKIAFHICMLLS